MYYFLKICRSIHVDEHFQALEFADVQYLDCDVIHLVVAVVASAVLLVFVVVFHYSIIALKK